MLRVEKNRYIQQRLLVFTYLGLLWWPAILIFFLDPGYGMGYNLISFSILFAVIIGSALCCWLVYFVLRLLNKYHYIFDEKGVGLYRKEEELFFIEQHEIVSLVYFKWNTREFILEGRIPLGSRYLHIQHAGSVHSISMSAKQAVAAAKILRKEVKIGQ